MRAFAHLVVGVMMAAGHNSSSGDTSLAISPKAYIKRHEIMRREDGVSDANATYKKPYEGTNQESANENFIGHEISDVKKLLKDDKLFMMDWAPTGNRAKTIADGCGSFEGNGFLCYIESAEHALVQKWIPATASVMEFGARFGTTTCKIAEKTANSGRLVSVEPDHTVWGSLEKNIKSHNCRAHVLRGVIGNASMVAGSGGYGARTTKTKTLDSTFVASNFLFKDVEATLGFKIDTLLIDCEGCAQHMMDQIGPKIKTQINLVLLEADMGNDGGDCRQDCMDYKKFIKFLNDSGLEMVDKFNDCDRSRSTAPKGTWCGSWIYHYAFKRKVPI